jgi:hypothetical protein
VVPVESLRSATTAHTPIDTYRIDKAQLKQPCTAPPTRQQLPPRTPIQSERSEYEQTVVAERAARARSSDKEDDSLAQDSLRTDLPPLPLTDVDKALADLGNPGSRLRSDHYVRSADLRAGLLGLWGF